MADKVKQGVVPPPPPSNLWLSSINREAGTVNLAMGGELFSVVGFKADQGEARSQKRFISGVFGFVARQPASLILSPQQQQ